MDIRMASDDSILVIHDETIDRTTNGTGRVDQFTYEQLKGFSAGYARKFDAAFESEKIPSLFEMLESAKGKINVCIDLKNVPENPVVDLIVKMDMKEEVYFMSYNVDKLIRIREIDLSLKTILLKNTLTHVDLSIAEKNGFTGVSGSYLSAELLSKKAHELGLFYWVGVVDDPAKAERLFKSDVDAVLTDYPQLMTFNNDPIISVSPNPFSESVEIHLEDAKDVQKLLILNNSGSVVYEITDLSNNVFIWRPENHLPDGIYYIYIITGDVRVVEKLLFVD
jgi:glycerophosphoryl diester phosphodiesterase